ncbi:mechanosensitive ion channel family protein [Moraxella sp. VT-16-12]|uniref:mechanosensitive ion channel family protein n=1 Tax=Moraxella sp. VT-16-12 TaxID=2014877 RepID=UPI000B7D7457|nr:mechanosensitive ion channel family protein [Moraxella sp. VT-16-12]TWV84043.1 mechanosensitive ion channel family protein [Moraxella sp. VT-16-12]
MTNTTAPTNDVVKDVTQASETVKEATKEVVTHTTENLTQASDYTLHLLGIPVDTATLINNSTSFGVKLLLAVIIFFVGKWIGKRFVNIAKRAMQRSSMDGTAVSFLGNLLYGVVLAAVVLASLNQLGISTTSFVAVLGALTVAIGVSLKDQVSNLAAGVLIVIFRPFRRGDSVEIAGKIGRVEEITLVNTRIRTVNNHEIIVPNGDIMTTATTNFSSYPNRRIEVMVGIGYDSDIRTARRIMLDLADAHDGVLKAPEEPIVRVTELADSSVNLTMYLWTTNDKWFAMQCDLLEAIKYAFDEAGINIPFPNRTVQIEGLDEILQKVTDK